MFTVTLEKECTCFKRSKFKANQRFESESEAFTAATKMAEQMTHEFCKRHAFSVIKEENDFLILIMY